MNDSYGMSIVQLLQKIVKCGGTSSGGNTGTGGNVSVDLSSIYNKLDTIIEKLGDIYSVTFSVADYTKPLAYNTTSHDDKSIWGTLTTISKALSYNVNGTNFNNVLTLLGSIKDSVAPIAFQSGYDKESIIGVLNIISNALSNNTNGDEQNNILTKLNNIESSIGQNSSVDMTDTNNLLSDISSKLTFERAVEPGPLNLENQTRKISIENVSIADGIYELIHNSDLNNIKVDNIINYIDNINENVGNMHGDLSTLAGSYQPFEDTDLTNVETVLGNILDRLQSIAYNNSINQQSNNNTNVILKDIMNNMFPQNYYVTPESDVIGPGPFMLCNITDSNITIKIIKYDNAIGNASDVTHNTLINYATDYIFTPGWNPIPIQYALDVPANSFTHAEYKSSIQ